MPEFAITDAIVTFSCPADKAFQAFSFPASSMVN
jgi:hypothetical protein